MRFLLIPGRTNKQGVQINVGKDGAEYQAIVTTLTIHPEDARELGLAAGMQLDQALHRLVEEFGERSGVLAIAEIDPKVAAELTGRATDIVQLAREALSNVSRHAEAATCRVSLYRDQTGAVLEIDDDGRGFNPAQAATGTGQGLRNLTERAEGLGGTAEIHSIPGEGTKVQVTIPG